MNDEPETLQALEESSAGTLDTLNTVVAWLHQEGFYAAESALLGEVENRYPDQSQSRVSHPSWEREPSTQGSLPPEDGIVDLGATSCILEEPSPADVPSSAERCVLPASTSFKLISCLSPTNLNLIYQFLLTVSNHNRMQGSRSMEK